MDIELTPEQLSAVAIEEIAQKAGEAHGIDSSAALALLRHIQWQADEIERIKVRLDIYLDKADGDLDSMRIRLTPKV